jgi:O-antigen polymerase
LLSFIIFLVFYSTKRDKPDVYASATRGGILGISVFSFFSYSSEILPVLISLVMVLAIFSEKQEPVSIKMISYRWNDKRTVPIIRILLTCMIIALAAFMYLPAKNLYKAYFSWDEGNQIYRMEAYQESLESFEESFDALKNNGEYLIMYGKALSMAGDYNKAIEILKRAEGYQKNTILYTALGDSYKQVGRYEDAGKAYLKASQMIPSRFYPKYLLVKLYDETGQHEKAIATAREIMNKKEKIPSTAIEEIKGEIKVLLEKYN